MEDVYVMLCGCELSEDRLIKIRSAKGCPEHKQKVKHIIRKCLDCPEIMEVPPSKSCKFRCDACAKKHAKETRKILNAERRAKEKAESNSDNVFRLKASEAEVSEYFDCIHRRACIDEAIKSRKGGKPLPCPECDRYETRMVV